MSATLVSRLEGSRERLEEVEFRVRKAGGFETGFACLELKIGGDYAIWLYMAPEEVRKLALQSARALPRKECK